MPGLELSAEQLTAVSGLPDVRTRLRPWVERGLVTASDLDTYTFAGGALDPEAWQLTHRRAELVAAFATWARRNPDAVLVAGGSAEPMRALQELARWQHAWRAVIAMGALLDVAYALAGRWDAWHSCLQATLEAARAVGDRAAEALALHQLGTRALVRGDLATARDQLGAALDLRLALGQTAAAGVTRQNLAVITDQPASARAGFVGALARIPMAVQAAAVLIPLLGALAFVGVGHADKPPQTSLDPLRLAFANQAVDHASPPQVIRLGNRGAAPLHVDKVALGGPNHGAFTLVDTSCVGAVPADGVCTATVVFTPATPGEQQANLSWHIRELPGDLSSPLVGVGVPAAATAPTVDPGTVAFAPQPLNTLSAPLPVRVVAGSAPLRLTGASTQGAQSADFLIDGDGCAAAVLAPAAACTVNVRFTPSAAGERSALLTVADSDGHPAATVALRGTGSAPPKLVRPATLPVLAPSVVAFGQRLRGTVGPPLTVTVTNRGDAPERLAGVAVDGGRRAFQLDAGNCADATLAPGGSCQVALRFAPPTAGPYSDVFAVTVSDVPGRATVALTGLGTDPTTARIPNVVGMPLAAAQRAVTAVGLRAGTATQQPSPNVPKGTVIDQAPTAGNSLPLGGAVNFVVSSGPVTVAVPTLVGQPQAQAAARLVALGLRVGNVDRRPDPKVPAGAVVACDPRPGSLIPRGSAVNLVVSTGAEPVAVPSVVGQSLANARSLLGQRQLAVGAVTEQPSDTVAKGVVISSDPGAGAQVAPGTAVGLVVSSGSTQVAVPDVAGSSLAAARSSIVGANLVVGAVREQASDTVAKGVVISSEPGAGARVTSGSRVGLVVSSGPQVVAVAVPDVAGSSLAAARSSIVGANLVVGAVREQASDTVAKGVVISSEPGAGARVTSGSRVGLVVSSGPVATAAATVPNVVGRTVARATAALQKVGLTAVPVDADGNPVTTGTVVSSDPPAGEPAPKNRKVQLTVQPGA